MDCVAAWEMAKYIKALSIVAWAALSTTAHRLDLESIDAQVFEYSRIIEELPINVILSSDSIYQDKFILLGRFDDQERFILPRLK